MTDHLAVDHLLDLAEEDLQRETGERVSEFAVRLSQRALQGEDGTSRGTLIPFQFFMPWP